MKNNNQNRIEFANQLDADLEKLGELFSKKHGYEYSYRIGAGYCFIDEYFFDLDDIIYDLKNNIKKGKIFDWERECLNRAEKGLRTMSFNSYCSGLTFEELDRITAEKLTILKGKIKTSRRLLKNSIRTKWIKNK